jgi:disulfide bond formation protein DsbB
MVVAVGLIMLAGCIFNSTDLKVRIFAAIACIMALLGAGVSARHVYIQHLPANEVPECGPGLAYMFNYLPINETLKAMVTGTGDCAKADWWLLGLSMPAWVLICFLFLFILNFYIFLRDHH